ncbi:Lipoyltransferase and lipoate-protein ligase [Neoconidiobolus thromboides FSU 785]|nr:Lipoyltransferase and lipoate-protein ligase [Neoconidiobolus thromboides FSU 785]
MMTIKRINNINSLKLLNQLSITKKFYSSIKSNEIDSKDKNKVSIYLSSLTDPYLNIAVEEWIIKKTPPNHRGVLYLYQNEACVVIGRSQNPWKESNLFELKKQDIKLVRRQSGGGTVYHDLGNSNYFVLMEREKFERIINVTLVKQALNQINLPVKVNERKDLTIDDLKISGSAYKISGCWAYHHGTMLIDTNLNSLSKVLKNNLTIESKGVDSVRSKVTNLINYKKDLNHSLFCKAIINQFNIKYNNGEKCEPILIDRSFLNKNPSILSYADKLKSWDWIYGQTPEFKLDHQFNFEYNNNDYELTLQITSKYGKIKQIYLINNSITPSILNNSIIDNFNLILNNLLLDQLFKKETINLQFQSILKTNINSVNTILLNKIKSQIEALAS